ncbi:MULTISPECIES: DEAD/DEAH box helicase [Methylorubrum]|uniref:DEAD-box ATP-dependent RNA helicase RhpA n=2 Tax=Methylorubrum extorquens TaxID=408 RepID=C5ARK9_METEA|nr:MULTISPECIES: DEAD/DEAH box helicase [Methylobacteriaceae]KQO89825.1 RNA helicase [Methylobacterium sp. Leaf90]KQO95011.1 RNA helicase [Methylobacterium sp. Leaf92]KQP87682.1 RNA helicase [Methylobacterium sp. Leaf119]KQP99071.1 RNA helicase [Methylobacterium sp. Leaf121]MDF9865213.1 ATP-dependent RNA helicase RhlE [Methylorubrum pseudosasae]MDH6638783.1 ATP-dependent RNA helicase RhlE [Methylobacterium sp. SuP10 SLI 274]
MTQFTDFGLAQPVLRALEEAGYVTPTPIQAQAVPPAMEGRDLCGIAQTGTGKTAAFALPILHRLSLDSRRAPRRGCRVLVLSPTRELASQIADSFSDYGRHLPYTNTVVFGGVNITRQERAIAPGVDILVATPGRLIDLVDRRALTLEGVEILVLDEADQMLDLGFIHALKRIVKMLPAKRQSLFFSATMPKNIAGLADQYLSNPVQVAVTPVATTAERVDQQVIFCHTGAKQALLNHVLRDPKIERVLVFTRTKHGADRVVRGLDKASVVSAAIHGNKSQPQRERALAAFRDGSCRVLVATDIAARGIDVDGVTHVVNYDLPNVPESYVHRIGRTARAGAEGQAISFCNDEERAYLRDIERTTRQKIPVGGFPEGFVPPTRQEAQDNAAEEARRPPRQPQGRPGQRQGRPGGGRGQGGEGRGEPRAHEARGGRPGGQPGHRQDQRAAGAPRPDGQRQDQRRPERAGEARPQGARPQGARPSDGRRDGRPARSGGEGGRAIGWLDRAPRT